MEAARQALNSFLKDAGFAARGDLVLLEPERSGVREIRRAEKAVVATISTRARDRHGDIVDPKGVRLERFRKNPVVLYAHDYGGLPVARSMWERLRLVDNGRDGGGELIAKPQFHLDTELSREVWALVEKGVLSAWSVGFIPEKWEPITASPQRTQKTDGERQRQKSEPSGTSVPNAVQGFRVTKWDLLEYSCVPVPANFQALTHELKQRRITAPALVKSLAPLGLEGPDLVPTAIRIHHGDSTTEANGVTLPHRSPTRVGAGRVAEAGRKAQAVEPSREGKGQSPSLPAATRASVAPSKVPAVHATEKGGSGASEAGRMVDNGTSRSGGSARLRSELRVSVVKGAVRSAFDRWLLRAKGGL